MSTPYLSLTAPRLLAAFGTLTLLAGLGLISSRPAHTAGGPVSVTVANTPLAVTVANTPLAVTTSGGTPVEGYVQISTTGGSALGNVVYTVPAGKQLLVDSMSLFSTGTDTANGYTGLVIHNDALGTAVSYATLNAAPNVAALPSTTQPMHLHLGPGEQLLINVFKTSPTGGIHVYVSLSGTLTDAP